MFGLRTSDIAWIVDVLEKRPEVDYALVFGSRALNTYNTGSDVDIALAGKDITHTTINAISYQLNEESPMPYQFDVLDLNRLQNINLVEHINTLGVPIYRRNKASLT